VGAAAAGFTAQVGALVAHQLVAAQLSEVGPVSFQERLGGVTAEYRRLLVVTAHALVLEVVALCAELGAPLHVREVQQLFALAEGRTVRHQ
jgi:hypothetical protein